MQYQPLIIYPNKHIQHIQEHETGRQSRNSNAITISPYATHPRLTLLFSQSSCCPQFQVHYLSPTKRVPIMRMAIRSEAAPARDPAADTRETRSSAPLCSRHANTTECTRYCDRYDLCILDLYHILNPGAHK